MCKRSFLPLLLLTALILTACGQRGSALLGRWERVREEATQDEISLTEFLWLVDQIEFLRDGTVVMNSSVEMLGESMDIRVAGQYSFPESGRIKFEFPEGTYVYKYEVSGDRLTLWADEETKFEFVKKR